jgi:hypothetical protein
LIEKIHYRDEKVDSTNNLYVANQFEIYAHENTSQLANSIAVMRAEKGDSLRLC